MLIKTKRNCYDYGSTTGLKTACKNHKKYREFNREQQAQIIQDYYTRLASGNDVTAYELFIAEMRVGDL